MGREARYWRARNGGVQCLLCPQRCYIPPGRHGACRARVNRDGTLVSEIYGRVSSVAVDPTEKKPLYHFWPGSYLLSLGSVGCNFACPFCQNWHISQSDAPTRHITPQQAVQLALRARDRDSRCIGIAYTYNEPFIWYEYVYDCCELAAREGLVNVLVTNGYVNREPLEALLPLVAAMNVDVKAFSDEFYRELCRAQLEPVKETVERAHRKGCHVEVTTLIIPGWNDGEEEIRALSRWLAQLSPDLPLHLSRFFPNHQMIDVPPTPVETLKRLRAVARAHLRFVYLGNVWVEGAQDTVCPDCGQLVLAREGLSVSAPGYRDGACRTCGSTISLVGQPM